MTKNKILTFIKNIKKKKKKKKKNQRLSKEKKMHEENGVRKRHTKLLGGGRGET
jgi:hypothetical protein